MYLLDTNNVSELRKTRPHGAVLQWLGQVEEGDLHLPVVTLGEIQKGIEITRDQDADKAAEIEAWLELLTGSYNIVPMDSVAFRVWTKLMHRASDASYEDARAAQCRSPDAGIQDPRQRRVHRRGCALLELGLSSNEPTSGLLPSTPYARSHEHR